MRYKYIYITSITLLFVTGINGQNKMNEVLAEIAKNNKSIIANQQYLEAKKLLYKTGLTPENPKVEYEYLAGSGPGGDQTDIFVVQTFDFPTTYIKKNQVANSQLAQTDFQITSYRQNILLKSKTYCIELVYLNKKQVELAKRVENASKLYDNYQTKLDNGGSNILDVNKAKLQLLNLQNELRMNTSKINQYNQKITELNGGKSITFNETDYPISSTVPDYNQLQTTIEENDPDLKIIHQQNEIDQKKLELSRAMSLPKLEGGYRSQSFAGQTIKGVHVGISIPLWENKNAVKHQKAHLLFNSLQVEEHHNEHHHEIKQLYEQYLNLSLSLAQYQQLLNTVNNRSLLNKALELGEISAIDYFLELNYFYQSYDNYLEIEKDYHQVVAKLFKHEL